MADASRGLSKFYRLIWITGGHHSPAIDKDLRSNLLSDNLAVQFHRPTHGRVYATSKPQVRRVLCRLTKPTPPQNTAPLNQIIKPAFANLFWRDFRVVCVIFKCSNKREGAGNIVVGNDERHVKFVVHIVFNVAKLPLNMLVGPSFKRPPQIDTDDLA